MTLASRLLGFVRDIVMAHIMGASAATDAFVVAFRLPNMLRQIFAEGAFSVAFVPLLSRQQKEHGQQAAEVFAGGIFVALMGGVVVLTLLFMAAMPWIIRAIAPGFKNDPATFDLAVTLSRITFPYLVFIVQMSFMSGVLNTLGRFAIAAFTPTLLNVSFLLCLWTIPHFIDPPALAAAIAVPVGGVMQSLLVWVAVKRTGFKLRYTRPKNAPLLGTLLKRMGPALVGVGAQQINALVSMQLASMLAASSISYLYYADRLNQLPLALIGIALATALLPTLSRTIKGADNKTASRVFEHALVVAMALGFAAATGLGLLADDIMIALFQRGAFTQADALASGAALTAFSLGLPAYILVKICSSAFYAAEDTKTPVKCALVSIGVNLALNLALMPVLHHVGLALATAIAAWVNFSQQIFLIFRHKLFQHWQAKAFFRDSLKVLAVTLVIGVVITAWRHTLPLPDAQLLRFAWLAGIIGTVFIFWAAGLYATGLHRLLLGGLKKRKA